jgi:hypothetical protein
VSRPALRAALLLQALSGLGAVIYYLKGTARAVGAIPSRAEPLRIPLTTRRCGI